MTDFTFGGNLSVGQPSNFFAQPDGTLNVKKILSQDFQTPAETGEDRYARFAAIYPVMKVSLDNNKGDGPSIDAMVAASNEFVNKMDANTYRRIRKNFDPNYK